MATFSTTNISSIAILTNSNETLTSQPNVGASNQSVAAIDVNYTSGQLYAKMTIDDIGSGTNNLIAVGLGITGMNFNHRVGSDSLTWGWYNVGGVAPYVQHGGHGTTLGVSVTTGDVLGLYFDFDNGFAYLEKNGTMMNGGNPASGSAGTGAMFGFPIGQSNYYILGVTNNKATTSQLTINAAGTNIYGYTNI